MKTLTRLCVGVLGCFAVFAVQAQPPEDMPVLPVEMYGCNYAGDSDLADLERSFDAFNEWADENAIDDLEIFLLTPNFVSQDFEFDIVGMSIWSDGAAFGSGNDKMTADPDGLSSFSGVVECAAHGLYALVGVKPPPSGVQDGGMLEFTNCTMEGNRSNNEGLGAVIAASEFFGQWNLDEAHGALFNISGEPLDTTYQFKWITYYPSYSTFGSLFDHMVNEDGVAQMNAILDPVMDCDSSRMYTTSVMRLPAEE